MKDKLTKLWSDHDHEFLIGFGTAAWLTTTIWSVAVTPAAMKAIEEKKKELGVEKLTLLQTLEAAGYCYVGPFGLGIVASLSIFGGVKKANRKRAAIAATCSVAENILRDYKDKVVEVIGEEKEKKIEEEIREEHKDEPGFQEQATYIFGAGDIRAFDNVTKQWMTLDSVETYRAAINDLNAELISDNSITVDDYCDLNNLPRIDGGNELEWTCYSKKDLLDPYFEHAFDSHMRPYLIVGVDRPPLRV